MVCLAFHNERFQEVNEPKEDQKLNKGWQVEIKDNVKINIIQPLIKGVCVAFIAVLLCLGFLFDLFKKPHEITLETVLWDISVF